MAGFDGCGRRKMKQSEKIKRRNALKDTIDQYYAEELLVTLLANGFTEDEICKELRNMMKCISKTEEGIKQK